MRVVDLFCGEGATSEVGGWSSAFRARGHETFTVDFDPAYKPDLVADITQMTAKDLPWRPDIILASPPCQGWSVATCFRNWTKLEDGSMEPKSPKAELSVRMVQATINIIRESGVPMWIIENPRGMLRKHPVMGDFERRTVTYCQYGRDFMKPTDLWGGFPSRLVLWAPCKIGAPCHVASPRGSQTGTQGRARLESTHVPLELSNDVCRAAEQELA